MILKTTTVGFKTAFRDRSNALFDPQMVLLTLQAPNGTQTEYLYGEDPEVVKVSTGNYRADIDLAVAGTWIWRWECGNSLKAAHEGTIVVRQSLLTEA